MGILKNNQKKETRFEKGDFIIYEPNEYQKEEIMQMLEKQQIKIEDKKIVGEVDLKFVRYILRELTSIKNEVDEYDDKELGVILENGNRDMTLFVREVKRLINEMIEDLVYIQEEEAQIILKMLNIFSTGTTNVEIEKKFNNLMKRNKINLTFDQIITNKNSKELGDMIKESKKNKKKK